MIESRTYRIVGRVQGVGFRWFAWDAATREGLAGFVANLPDGSVEAVVEGDRDALDRFEWKISSGPAGARVDHVDRETGPGTGRYQGFSVKG
jgi:acylphosphatase